MTKLGPRLIKAVQEGAAFARGEQIDPPMQLHLFRSRRQRGVAPPPAKEFRTQVAVADILQRWSSPNWAWTHIGHGELRDTITATKLKRAGLQPGWPDLILLPPKGNPIPSAHFLELKRRGNTLSEPQAAFQLWAMLNGCPFAVAYSVNEAIEILKQWGAVRAGIHVQ